MLAGELYRAADPELQAEMAATQRWIAEYNADLAASVADRRQLLLRRLSHVGENVEVRPPFFCDYGFNIRIGRWRLLTVFPAALIGFLPAEAVRAHTVLLIAAVIGAAALYFGLALLVFNLGLRQYASGNRFAELR